MLDHHKFVLSATGRSAELWRFAVAFNSANDARLGVDLGAFATAAQMYHGGGFAPRPVTRARITGTTESADINAVGPMPVTGEWHMESSADYVEAFASITMSFDKLDIHVVEQRVRPDQGPTMWVTYYNEQCLIEQISDTPMRRATGRASNRGLFEVPTCPGPIRTRQEASVEARGATSQ